MKMKHRKSGRGVTAGLMLVFLCAVLLLGTASPALALNGSVTVRVDNERLLKALHEGETVILNLYKLAGKDSSGWTYGDTPSFAGISEDLCRYEEALQAGATPDLKTLDKISKLIKANDIKPLKTQKFSSAGMLTFDNLPEGLYYYMLADRVTVDGYTLTMQGAIVPVPFIYKGDVLYGMETKAKADWMRPVPPAPPSVPTPTPSGPVSTPVPRIVDYGIPLGIDVIINHVGDCYE